MITLQNHRTGQELEFASLDAAYRYIVDSRIRFWSMFQGKELVMASDNTYIPAIDGEAA